MKLGLTTVISTGLVGAALMLGAAAAAADGSAVVTVSPGTISYSAGTVTVSGSGWREHSTIDLTFSGDGLDNDSNCFGLFSVQVNDSGQFSVTVPLSNSVDAEDGGCQLTVTTEGDGPSASVVFQITD